MRKKETNKKKKYSKSHSNKAKESAFKGKAASGTGKKFRKKSKDKRSAAGFNLVLPGIMKEEIFDRWEFISACILMIWCFLPIVILIHNICLGLSGKYQLVMTDFGYDMPYEFYYSQVRAFLMAVRILGSITVAYAAFCLFICHKRIFSRSKVRTYPWMYLMMALLGWTVICSVLSEDFKTAFAGIPLIYSGLASILIYAAVLICASMIRREWYRKILLRTFCGVLVFLSVLLFIKVYADSFLDKCFILETTSVFNQKNHWCYMLCMGTMCALGLYLFDDIIEGEHLEGKPDSVRKCLYLGGFGILFYALLLSDTFGAFLAVLVSTPFLYILYIRSGRKIHAATWLPAVVFIGISVMNSYGLLPQSNPVGAQLYDLGKVVIQFVGGEKEETAAPVSATEDDGEISNIADTTTTEEETEKTMDPIEARVLRTEEKDLPEGMTKDDLLTYYYGDNTTRRIILWKNTIYRIKERPIFGFGPEGFHDKYAITYNDSPHNEYLQRAAYIGIPGLLLYLLALLVLFIHHWKKAAELDPMVLAASGGVVGYLISAFFGNPVFNTAPYFFMLLGLVTANNENEPPLIALEEEQEERDFQKKVLVKRNGIILIILVIAAITALAVVHHQKVSEECERELADLQMMRDASANLMLARQNNTLDLGAEYWYDKLHNRLIPATEPAPAPYGQGTELKGNGLEKFNKENNLNYEYDENEDYTKRVLKVSAEAEENESLSVSMAWTNGAGE